jgi:hypothetical protein
MEPTYACLACWDEPEAWRVLWCCGGGAWRAAYEARPHGLDGQTCGRTTRHRAHTFAVRCGCVDTNPARAAYRHWRDEYRRRRAMAQAARQAML